MPAHIYFSPHLDDAAYSCGGLIARQSAGGEPVAVLTVCAGDSPPGPLSPFAQGFHQRWEKPEGAAEARRGEDLEACAGLGASALHFGVPDAIYRPGPQGSHLYQTEESLFGPLDAAEDELVGQVAAALAEVCAPGARLYAPLGVGGHVDHQLTRRAAERLGRDLYYYRDFPYAARGGHIPPGLSLPQGAAVIHPLTPAEQAAWAGAIRAYGSQFSTFWEDEAGLARELRRFHDEAGGVALIAPL